jgi:hypothetical protein
MPASASGANTSLSNLVSTFINNTLNFAGAYGVTSSDKTGSTNSDPIYFKSGNVVDGISGDLTVQPGSASGTGSRGNINLLASKINLLDNNALFIQNDYSDSYWATPQVAIVLDSAVPNDNANLFIGTTDVTSGESFSVTLFSGAATTTGNSGLMQFASGQVLAGSGHSGILEIF